MSFMLTVITCLPKPIRRILVPDMLIPPISNDPSKVQLIRLSHIYFEHPNLKEFDKFAKDFGFVEAERRGDTVYYRGYGKDPYVYVASKSKDKEPKFGGAAFVAASSEEFEKAAQLPGATVRALYDVPGGGKMVTIARPNGTFMYVVYAQEERAIDTSLIPSGTHDSQGPYNTPFEKPRLGTYNRMILGISY
jgi:hypothetical protein